MKASKFADAQKAFIIRQEWRPAQCESSDSPLLCSGGFFQAGIEAPGPRQVWPVPFATGRQRRYICLA